MATMGTDIAKSALIIVDMQNDFLHPDGVLGQPAKESNAVTISNVRRLVEAFREASRPVVYVAIILKPDFSDAISSLGRNASVKGFKPFVVEGTWGAQVVDELAPRKGEHVVIKKGFNGFSNTQLDTVLRNLGVNTCVVTGIFTSICVSGTIRGGVERNYRMIIVNDATADMQRERHEAELRVLAGGYADGKTSDEVLEMLGDIK